jgi:hypothetical protein
MLARGMTKLHDEVGPGDDGARRAVVAEAGDGDDGRPFLVLDPIALPAPESRSLADVTAVADEVTAALGAAHALGVARGELHTRDLGVAARAPQTRKLVRFGMGRDGGRDGNSRVFAFGALLHQIVSGLVSGGVGGQRYDGVERMMTDLRVAMAGSELVAELHVSAFIDPSAAAVEAAALDDVEQALTIAQELLEKQNVALVLGGGGAVVATMRIPRELDEQRAARAGWVQLAHAVRSRVQARPRKHPAVRTKVSIRIEG